MSAGVKSVVAASAISIVLSVSVTSAHTTADLSLQEWTINGSSKISQDIEGTTTMVDCPELISPCEVSYSGTVDVNLAIEDDQLVLSPGFSMSEVTYLEVAPIKESEVGSELDSEVESELDSEL